MRARSSLRASRVLLATGVVASALASGRAHAEAGELRLMHEPIAYTYVSDAFDDDDRFDLDVHLDYARSRDRGAIYREQRSSDGAIEQRKVADSRADTNLLTLGVDVGLWRDLMAFVRVPLVLRDVRELRGDGGGDVLAGTRGADGNASPLFALPFVSPARAGLDYLALGGAWALLNQHRTSWTPNWVLRIEGRRAIGKTLTACAEAEQRPSCGSRSREDRDGDGALDGTLRTKGEPGSSRGLSALWVETRFSRRYRHAEPYTGLALLAQWPSTARDVFQPRGEGRARPGTELTATLGTALIPWEDRGGFQRTVLDARLDVTYVASGTNYTPLFDALGSSPDPELAFARGGVPFYGVTEVDQHLRYGGQLGVELRAARYVRFAAGTTLHWVTAHALTDRVPERDRTPLDAPGHRFFLHDQFLLGIYGQATAMF